MPQAAGIVRTGPRVSTRVSASEKLDGPIQTGTKGKKNVRNPARYWFAAFNLSRNPLSPWKMEELLCTIAPSRLVTFHRNGASNYKVRDTRVVWICKAGEIESRDVTRAGNSSVFFFETQARLRWKRKWRGLGCDFRSVFEILREEAGIFISRNCSSPDGAKFD